MVASYPVYQALATGVVRREITLIEYDERSGLWIFAVVKRIGSRRRWHARLLSAISRG